MYYFTNYTIIKFRETFMSILIRSRAGMWTLIAPVNVNDTIVALCFDK